MFFFLWKLYKGLYSEVFCSLIVSLSSSGMNARDRGSITVVAPIVAVWQCALELTTFALYQRQYHRIYFIVLSCSLQVEEGCKNVPIVVLRYERDSITH